MHTIGKHIHMYICTHSSQAFTAGFCTLVSRIKKLEEEVSSCQTEKEKALADLNAIRKWKKDNEKFVHACFQINIITVCILEIKHLFQE